MLGGLFGGGCTVDLQLETDPNRKSAAVKGTAVSQRAFIYTDGEDVCGLANVHVKPGKKLEHQGIKVELIGRIETLNERAGNYDFFSITKDLEPPGSLYESKQYRWRFTAVDKTNETYVGTNVRLRYFIRLMVMRSYAGNTTTELDFVVQNLYPPQESNNAIKLEVGIEDCLHIEFEYSKSRYHLRDVVLGKIRRRITRPSRNSRSWTVLLSARSASRFASISVGTI